MHNSKDYDKSRKYFSNKSKDLKHGNNLYRACVSKRRYRTIEYAQKMAKIFTEKYGTPQYVYYCPYCFGYHLTSSPR